MFLNKEFVQFIDKCKQNKQNIVVVSVTHTSGSTYTKSGNMMLVNSEGEFTGVLGSKYLHKKILELADQSLKSKDSVNFENIPKDKSVGHGISNYFIQPFFYEENFGALTYAMNNINKTLVRSIHNSDFEIIDEKMQTKLEDDKFYQTIEAPYSILIFGSGSHVSSMIAMANLMGWTTTVIDKNIDDKYVKDADVLMGVENTEDVMNINFDSYNAAVILSHSPQMDDIYLKAVLDSNVEYIGIMGNKTNMRKKTEKFNLQNDSRFFAPIGLSIGGDTHQSIALAICAQIEAKKNAKI
ncbi:XdhC family protein [Sulfurospirillum arcachonense]|uniref:XdhC family protein n=1 Tax=Sulfurospirillum arcachonense TaxID=57666 RepID=UPI00046A42E8|nr:XdhC/CoxI family protein [Sulfurospirillum arcachonense]